MQHNSWKKDRELLAEAVGKVYSENVDDFDLGQAEDDTPPQYREENIGVGEDDFISLNVGDIISCGGPANLGEGEIVEITYTVNIDGREVDHFVSTGGPVELVRQAEYNK